MALFSNRAVRRKQAFLGRGLRDARLRMEPLEDRQMLSVSLGSLNDVQEPGGKSVLVPLTGIDSGGQPIAYTATSSNPNVTVSLVSPASKSLQLTVTGTDKNNQAFTGTLILHLFEDLSPIATSRIEQLVGQTFYNGTTFGRVLDGFVAQGGFNTSGTSGQTFDDQFNTGLTFNSPGLLAMANAGRDTNDAQFFITAIDKAGSTTPVTLADMPQFLNFRYTIFGQLVSGFSTFEKIMTTNVTTNSATGEVSKPTSPITITSAQLINDTQNAVLRVTAPASEVGHTSMITVTATGGSNATTQQSFTDTIVADTSTDPPFLGSVINQTTTTGTPITFNLTSTDPQNHGVAYKIVDPNTFSTPANVTATVNSAGQVTLTPAAGFTGTINLLAGVRASSANDVASNYDTQKFTLTVNAATSTVPAPTALSLDPASDNGNFNNDNYTSVAAPVFHITAQTGLTVKIKVAGTVVATATEGAAGQYTATLPAGSLAVGANSVTAVASNSTATSSDSTALSVTYAPNFDQIYTVPGAPGSTQQLTFTWKSRQAAYNNEIGIYTVTNLNGTVAGATGSAGTAPGAAGYANAAIGGSSSQVIFTSGQGAGATKTITVHGGQLLGFYLIQNNTTSKFLANNSADQAAGNANASKPLAFFSITTANPDGQRHLGAVADPSTGTVQYNWEDLFNKGDADYNDAVITVGLGSTSAPAPSTLHVPDAGSNNLKLTGTLEPGTHLTSAPGDVGVFFVDNPSGAIGNLQPGSAGYLAAALASANSHVLFASGTAAGVQQQVTVPAGKYIAFYAITSGTTANFLTANPTNSTSGGPVALLSFDAANPNQLNHFRWTSPEGVATTADTTHLHIVDQVFGSSTSVDDLSATLSFGP